jgi:F-type H+-transporting ATPase subunit a
MKTEIADNQLFLKNMSFIKVSFVTILTTLFSFSVNAQTEKEHDLATNPTGIEANHGEEGNNHTAHEEKHEKSSKFDPGKMIMEHIADAHDWHLWGEGHNAVSIALPVIIYTKSKGITLFSSSKFEHGHASYEGFKLDSEGHIVWEDKLNTEQLYDISLTKNVIAMFIAVLTLCIIIISMANSYSKRQGKAPKGIHNLIEPLIIFIRDDVAKPSIGHKTDKFMPLLLTVFFFIFVNNVFGLIPIFPGGANVTGNIAVTMVLALVIFLTVNLNGNKYYWKHIFMPDVPVWMYVIIIPIELLGVILKPFVLMLRLFANITAGHIIILGFFSLIFIFGAMSPAGGIGVSPLSVAFTVFMGLLEMLVAFLQAFVFTLLSAIYIGMAVEEHHH